MADDDGRLFGDDDVPRFDLNGERAARDDALGRVVDHADDGWLIRARGALEHVARAQRSLSADDVWRTGLEKPREARALGPVMLWARARGYIAPTRDFVPTAQIGCHASPQRVWRSLVFGQPPGTTPAPVPAPDPGPDCGQPWCDCHAIGAGWCSVNGGCECKRARYARHRT